MAAVIFPWPAREERRARVEDARRQAEQAQRKSAEARFLVEELHRLRSKNHVSEALDQWIAGRGQQGRG